MDQKAEILCTRCSGFFHGLTPCPPRGSVPSDGPTCPACLAGDHGSIDSELTARTFKCNCACHEKARKERERALRCAWVAADRIWGAGHISQDQIAEIIRETIEKFAKGIQI